MSDVVLGYDKRKTNADLIVACMKLGYLHEDWATFDPAYGEGVFWRLWTPKILIASDLDVTKSPIGKSIDFTALPFLDEQFVVTVFDGPYKLNGTPDKKVDERYGVHETTKWRDRMQLLDDGLVECCRVTSSFVLMKCQDQVCCGKVRWQTDIFKDVAGAHGFGLYDRLDFPSYRKQPSNRTKKHTACKGTGCTDCDEGRVPSVQQHAARNFSSLLVLKRGHDPRT